MIRRASRSGVRNVHGSSAAWYAGGGEAEYDSPIK